MSGAPPPSDPPSSRESALGLVAELLERLRDPQVRELEVRQGELRVRVSRDGARAAPAAEAVPAEAAATSGAQPALAGAAKTSTITAPLTGIFYRSASPQAPAFVQVGTVVSPGDTIGLIEAMKLFNEVRSTAAGRVRTIVAENGQLVRAHQPLLELD